MTKGQYLFFLIFFFSFSVRSQLYFEYTSYLGPLEDSITIAHGSKNINFVRESNGTYLRKDYYSNGNLKSKCYGEFVRTTDTNWVDRGDSLLHPETLSGFLFRPLGHYSIYLKDGTTEKFRGYKDLEGNLEFFVEVNPKGEIEKRRIFNLLRYKGDPRGIVLRGPWEIEKKPFLEHPFKTDSLVLVRPSNVKKDWLGGGYSVLERKENPIILLNFYTEGMVLYNPNHTLYLVSEDIYEEGGADVDSLSSKYADVFYSQTNDSVTFIFYNDDLNLDQMVLEKAIAKEARINKMDEKTKCKFDYKIVFQSTDKIVLIKTSL